MSGENPGNGADAVVEMLLLHGTTHIFGLCGDTSLPLYDALYRRKNQVLHVLARDERHAGYMADGYARVSGKVGVCEGPSGGGATYLLPALAEANESSSPVLGITTDVPVTSRGRYPLTEIDQQSLYRPVTKWNASITQASQIPQLMRTAFRAMTTGAPGAAHLSLPYDVQKAEMAGSDLWAGSELGSYPALRTGPDPDAIDRATALLVAAEHPVFVCGGGVLASRASRELDAVATMLGAPVCSTVSGKGTLSDAHPLMVGVVGANGGVPPTRDVLQGADLVIFVGCRAGSTTTENWRVPRTGTRIIHIDIDPMVIGANYPIDVGIAGDAKLSLSALAAALQTVLPLGRRPLAAAEQQVREARARKRAAFERLALSDELPIRPERIVRELNRALPGDAIVVADPGTACPYFAAYYELAEEGRHFLTNRAHGALGYALSAAVGAWYARPSSKVVAVMGDGSFGFTAGELETLTRLRIPITLIVLANQSYGWIKASQKASYGQRYFSVDLSATDHAAIAASYGLKAWKVSDPADLAPALQRAVESSDPTLVEVLTQPLEDAAAPVSQWMG